MAFEVTSTGMYTGWWMILTGREKPSCSFTEQLFNLDSLSCKKMQQVYIYIQLRQINGDQMLLSGVVPVQAVQVL